MTLDNRRNLQERKKLWNSNFVLIAVVKKLKKIENSKVKISGRGEGKGKGEGKGRGGGEGKGIREWEIRKEEICRKIFELFFIDVVFFWLKLLLIFFWKIFFRSFLLCVVRLKKKKRSLLHQQKDDMGSNKPLHPSTIAMRKIVKEQQKKWIFNINLPFFFPRNGYRSSVL